MSSDSSGHDTHLAEHLDHIVERATVQLQNERSEEALWSGLGGRGFWFLWTIPVLQIVVLLFARLFGVAGGKLASLDLWIATIILGGSYVIAQVFRARRHAISATTALSEVDRRLQLHDRLSAAHEFLHRPSSPSGGVKRRTAFMEAAIEDARSFATASLDRDFAQKTHRPWARRTVRFAGSGLLLLFLAGAIPPLPAIDGSDPGPGWSDPLELAAHSKREQHGPEREAPSADVPIQAKVPPPAATETTAGAKPGVADTPLDDRGTDLKRTEGRTQSGKPAEASFSSGSSESRGSPSTHGQSSLRFEKKLQPAKKKTKKKPTKKSGAEKPPEKEKPSGATAGRGAASGSNKSPSVSEWSSRDKVISEDEDDLEADEEVDDEFDIADARAGLQPQLRDRKPPANRDLSISFGNGKDPDANGRGGQSEQKKSRGVASLVLGVPIPDHVKGKPNPGKTKVTQERVKPLKEESEGTVAQEQLFSRRSAGHYPRPDLTPWMRDYLRAYYLSLRASESAPPTPKKAKQ